MFFEWTWITFLFSNRFVIIIFFNRNIWFELKESGFWGWQRVHQLSKRTLEPSQMNLIQHAIDNLLGNTSVHNLILMKVWWKKRVKVIFFRCKVIGFKKWCSFMLYGLHFLQNGNRRTMNLCHVWWFVTY